MKRIVCAIAALAAFVPLTAAHAAPPFSCEGSPEVPETYICLVRFQVGADPYLTSQNVTVPAQSVVIGPYTQTVPGQSQTVQSQTVHVPQVCLGLGNCVGPFDATTPQQTVTTPPVDVTAPQQTVSTPAESATVPIVGVAIPSGATIVLWYQSTCYYIYPDGNVTQMHSALNSGC
jgi:hypothetical protein